MTSTTVTGYRPTKSDGFANQGYDGTGSATRAISRTFTGNCHRIRAEAWALDQVETKGALYTTIAATSR